MGKVGPNVKKLVSKKAALIIVPVGSGSDSSAKVVSALLDPKKIVVAMREAAAWVERAIQAVREAAEPNEWKDADDETIAAEIVREMEKREQKNLQRVSRGRSLTEEEKLRYADIREKVMREFPPKKKPE